jgi:hypothetical protein
MDGQDIIFVDVWRMRLKGLVNWGGIPYRPAPIGLIGASVDHDAFELEVAVPLVLFKQHISFNSVINESINIICLAILVSRGLERPPSAPATSVGSIKRGSFFSYTTWWQTQKC